MWDNRLMQPCNKNRGIKETISGVLVLHPCPLEVPDTQIKFRMDKLTKATVLP